MDTLNGIDKQPNEIIKNDHYIVAIGASAGGLEAIHDFFDHMPDSGNLSFIIIQHLSSDHKSLLVELVSKHTHMRVFEAEHNMELRRQCVYVIPNNKVMTVKDGMLHLANKSDIRAPNAAIDIFLHSLAKDKKNKAIAVILSGTGSDGTRGIQSIKAEGGIVLVQDPLTAKFDGMPHSAIATGKVDSILSPQQMPEEIYAILKETPVHILRNGTIDAHLLDEIYRLVSKSSGFDFNQYKTATIIRRLGKRMMQNGLTELDDYVHLLHTNEQEARELSKDFLINVTSFFRDKQAYEIIARKVIPSIVHQKAENDTLKVWVIACSTGEEAYSLAILIDQHLQQVNKNLDIKIFATDIDNKNIESAAKNQFPHTIKNDIEPATLEKYFIDDGSSYSVIPRIRRWIVFARHNVIKDPSFIKNDLIACRNMLIYMNPALQQKILTTIHYSLNTGGYLFFGSSETVSFIKSALNEIDSKWKIYCKTGTLDTRNHQDNGYFDPANLLRKTIQPAKLKEPLTPLANLYNDFSETMMDDLGYTGLYIDGNYEIKETVGGFNKYLSLPQKTLTLNILKMVPKEMASPLNAAIRKCWKEKRKVSFKKTLLNKSARTALNIIVKPGVNTAGKIYTLVIIGETRADEIPEEIAAGVTGADRSSADYIMELENELDEARHSLEKATENMEATNEELQSTNEEMLSANEELQSSNEELQSLNEELHTLNTEHQLKIKELLELNDDLNNYFRSTEIGQVFVDAQLKLRKFNPSAIKLINLIETDIGRPITHISTNLEYPEMVTDIREVILRNTQIEKEIPLNNGSISLVKIIPYLRRDQQIDGAVITFIDITNQKSSEQELRKNYSELIVTRETLKKLNTELEDKVNERTRELVESEERFRLVAMATNDALWDWNIIDGHLWWGPNFYPMFGYQETGPVKTRNFWIQQIHHNDRTRIVRLLDSVISKGESKWSAEYRFMKADGHFAYILDRGYILRDDNNSPYRMVGSMLDITDQKEATKIQIQKKDEFLSIASHELKTPITSMKAFLQFTLRMIDNKEDLSTVHSFITKANGQVNKLTSLIEDLLDVTKIQAGKVQFDVTTFSIGDVISDCLDQVQHYSHKHSIQVEGNKDQQVEADQHRIEQVITNFLSNAIKYSPTADKIILRIEEVDEHLKISVKDYGIGIPENRIPFIFDRFFRVQESSQKFSGLGLGLYICSEIVKRHKGKIGVSSEPGEGSVFWFTIPLKNR